METDILISVIIPVYNVEDYILRTVDSVLSQTYTNIEIVLIDDGSNDKTPEIVDSLLSVDSRIKVIHQENQGVTSARLNAVSVAKGEYIGFVDGDDVIDSNMYKRLLENALKYNAKISHCGYQMVFPDHVDYYYNTGRVVKQDNLQGVLDLLEGLFVEPGLWNKIYHRSLFTTILADNLVDRSIRINEDLLMNYYLFRMSENSIYEDFCPYYYMIRKGSAAMSKSSRSHVEDPIKVLKILMRETSNQKPQFDVCKRRYVEALIRLISDRRSYDIDIRNYQKQARIKLRKLLPDIMTERYCNKSTKVKAFGAAVSPTLYYKVHKLYSEKKGTAYKYRLD